MPVTISAGHTTVGTPLISTVAVRGVPSQPLYCGMMVKVTVSGCPVVFTNVPLIGPVPLAGMPVASVTLSRVQLYVIPWNVLEGMISVIGPEQMVCVTGPTVEAAKGSATVAVAVKGVPGQPFTVGVMVKVTVTGALVLLMQNPLIVPEPLPPRPETVAVLSRVQV